MELVLLENEKNRLKFEIKGEEHSFCNMLRKELWNDKAVEIAGYKIEHSLISQPVFTVEVSKGNAKDSVVNATRRIRKMFKEMKDKSSVL